MAINQTAAVTEDELIVAEVVPVLKPEGNSKIIGQFITADDIDDEQDRKTAEVILARSTGLATKGIKFQEFIQNIETLGQDDIERASGSSNAILQRASTSMAASEKKGSKKDAASSLHDLRNLIEDLSPNNKTGLAKILGNLGGNRVEKHMRKFASSQDHLDSINKALEESKETIYEENSVYKNEKMKATESIVALEENQRVLAQMEVAVEKQISELENAGEKESANIIASDLLNPIRVRRVDLATSTTVAIQGFLSIDVLEKNNRELLKGINRTQTTTMSALKTAVLIQAGLEAQQKNLKAINAVKKTAEDLILQNAQNMQQTTLEIQENAAKAALDPEVTEKALSMIASALDSVDTFRINNNAALKETAQNLERQIESARGHVERVRSNDAALEGGSNNAARGIGR